MAAVKAKLCIPILNIWESFRDQISDMNEWIQLILGTVMDYDRTLEHVM